MDEKQITALAREYAEEMTKDIPSDNDIKCLRESAIKLNAEGMEKRLRWLSRRFCLVEKSKLQELEIARRAKANGYVALKRVDVEYLFPGIEKEVKP